MFLIVVIGWMKEDGVKLKSQLQFEMRGWNVKAPVSTESHHPKLSGPFQKREEVNPVHKYSTFL